MLQWRKQRNIPPILFSHTNCWRYQIMAEVNLLWSQNNCVCNNTFLFLLIDPDLWTTSVVFCHLAVQPFLWFSMTLRGKGALGCYFLNSANSVLFWEFKKLQEWWAMVMIRCASVKIHSCCIHPWSNAVLPHLCHTRVWILGHWCWEPGGAAGPARRQLSPFHSPCVSARASTGVCLAPLVSVPFPAPVKSCWFYKLLLCLSQVLTLPWENNNLWSMQKGQAEGLQALVAAKKTGCEKAGTWETYWNQMACQNICYIRAQPAGTERKTSPWQTMASRNDWNHTGIAAMRSKA